MTPLKHSFDSLKKVISTRLKPGTKIILGISGGPDSVALLHLLLAAGFSPILAHVNYHLRGRDSDLDHQFVNKLAVKYQLQLEILEIYAKKIPGNLEENCRLIRYDFFEQARRVSGAELILTAHQLDDQIETFLFNLTRGASLSGFLGIAESDPKRHLLRPLLSIPKSELLAYLKTHKLPYRGDKSNFDLKFSRNLIRHKIIPVFQKINPNFHATIASSMASLRENLQSSESFSQQWLSDHFDQQKFWLADFLKLKTISQKNVLQLLYKKFNKSSLTKQTLTEIQATLQKNKANLRKEFGKGHWICIKKDSKTAKRQVVIETKLH